MKRKEINKEMKIEHISVLGHLFLLLKAILHPKTTIFSITFFKQNFFILLSLYLHRVSDGDTNLCLGLIETALGTDIYKVSQISYMWKLFQFVWVGG